MANFTPAAGDGAGGGNPAGNTVTLVNAATFIPEIWSDEIIAAYQKNLKMAPLVKKISMTGKKGDRIHIPKPTRGSASAKDAADTVTIQQTANTELLIDVDRHFEYSRLIEDIVEVQALNSLRQFYTEDAGYALALKVDTDLMNAATGFGDDSANTFDLAAPSGADWVNSNSYYFDAASAGGTPLTAFAASTVAAGDNFTDAGFRQAIQLLDDADVPMEGRCIIVPPVVRNTIMGEPRFSSSDFTSGQPVNTGLIGNLYGVDVYVSSNCPTLEANVRGCVFMHKDAIVHAEQMAVRSQTQYKQEYLSTLYTADTLYGVQVYRPEAGLVLAVYDA
jgi:N4-gp56 family major capsid protein